MSRISRTPFDEPTLSHRLQWHASQSLRRGIRCSVIVLQPMAIEGRVDSAACGEGADESPLEEVARRLRAILRRTDVVEVDQAVGIGVLLPDADEAGTSVVHGRIMRELGQRPAAKARPGTIEDVRFAIGRASAGPADTAQVPAVVRDLVCIASSPDVWMCVPVVRPAHRMSLRHGPRSPRGPLGASRARQSRRSDLRVLSPELGAASATDEGEALRRKADAQGVPFVRIPGELPLSLRRLLSPDLARELGAVPIGRTRGVLTVAMRDSSDLSALQRLAASTGLTIFPVLAAPDDLACALAALEPVSASLRQPVPVPTA
jgi:hypothetical protein